VAGSVASSATASSTDLSAAVSETASSEGGC